MLDEADAALRQLRAALERVRADPVDGDLDQLFAALTALRELRQVVAAWEPELITAARAAGASWRQLAPALGVTSRQAAERRYLRLRPSDTGETTGEARVRATRDHRAAQRAVSEWARDNAAELRQLAGQVSGLANLTPEGRHQADQVHAALAGDDPVGLLNPLADVRDHLAADHPALADRITEVSADADAHRSSTVDQRHPPES